MNQTVHEILVVVLGSLGIGLLVSILNVAWPVTEGYHLGLILSILWGVNSRDISATMRGPQ